MVLIRFWYDFDTILIWFWYGFDMVPASWLQKKKQKHRRDRFLVDVSRIFMVLVWFWSGFDTILIRFWYDFDMVPVSWLQKKKQKQPRDRFLVDLWKVFVVLIWFWYDFDTLLIRLWHGFDAVLIWFWYDFGIFWIWFRWVGFKSQVWPTSTLSRGRRTLRGRRATWRHPPSLRMAGVALGDIYLRLAWQAWHLVTSTFLLRGRRGPCGTGLALVARLGALARRWRRGTLRARRGTWRHPPSLRVARVALGDIHLRFVAGVALGDIHLALHATLHATLPKCCQRQHFRSRQKKLTWLWWRAWARIVARGAAPLCVAGVALGDIHLRFAWHAWHLATSTFASWQAWHLATSTFVLRGRRGTCGIGLALVVRLGADSRQGRRATLRGRRGTWWHPPSFCVAGVALVALGWWRAWARLVAQGAAPLCAAGVALGDIHLRFAWLYTERLLDTEAFYTQRLLHREVFTLRRFCTQTRLHRAFTHRTFYTEKWLHRELLHTDAFAHRSVYTEKPLHRGAFTHTRAFTHRSCYTQALLHKEAFTQRAWTHRRVWRPIFLYKEVFTQRAFTHGSFHTQKFFTQRSLDTEKLLRAEAFSHRSF